MVDCNFLQMSFPSADLLDCTAYLGWGSSFTVWQGRGSWYCLTKCQIPVGTRNSVTCVHSFVVVNCVVFGNSPGWSCSAAVTVLLVLEAQWCCECLEQPGQKCCNSSASESSPVLLLSCYLQILNVFCIWPHLHKHLSPQQFLNSECEIVFSEVKRSKIVITEIIAFNGFFTYRVPLKCSLQENKKGTMF